MSSSLLLSVPLTSACIHTHTQTLNTFSKDTSFISKPFSKTRTNQNHFKVSCNLAPDHDHTHHHKPLIIPETPNLILPNNVNVDRRNMLVGLGGLYTTLNLPPAFANPITTPDITKQSNCKTANEGIGDLKNAVRTQACCPSGTELKVKDFEFPRERIVRMRWAAHRGSAENVAKYKEAIQAMRDLKDDHPHSFVQQAKIHCAYCNGGYKQDDESIQVHNCWLFYPFHRWYLYFYERILGKLIGDPTFALPYWNWDNPGGMTIPYFFEGEGSGAKKNPLFDAYRDAGHLPPAIVDLDFNGKDSDATCIERIGCNLSTMYRQMIRNAPDTKSFFGGEYRAGDKPIGMTDKNIGSIEAGAHTAIHRWVGNSRMPNNEDLGNFYSAGYDPLFYVHHSNVDRMWKLWKDLGRYGHTEPKDKDWLEASYVFYDENEEPVRVKNQDCIHMSKLNYDYEKSELTWLKGRPIPRSKNSQIGTKYIGKVKTVEELNFPVKLDGIVKFLVKRPTKPVYVDMMFPAPTEILFINGIKFNSEKFVKFDVFVNDKEDGTLGTACDSEFAGSFAQVPHSGMNSMFMTSAVSFGLDELLEDIGAEDDEFLLIKLVPKIGCEDLTISEVKIKYVRIFQD